MKKWKVPLPFEVRSCLMRDESRFAVPTALVALVVLTLSFPSLASAAKVEDELNARWRGGWVDVKVPISSSCDGYYNDNEVVGLRTTSKARERFDDGETAQVERIDVKRSRVDVYLDLGEELLVERVEGPFTLYDARRCKIQLRIPVPARSEAEAIEARLAELLELHDSRREAEASKSWNRRRLAPLPKDYDRTLGLYATWKAEQTNIAVQERMNDAREEAARISSRRRSNTEYMSGYADGMDKGRRMYMPSDCASLLTATFSYDSRKGSDDWQEGYEDGQRASWNLELLNRLGKCFVPVPPPPRS